jgi:hypothetical protein
MPVFDVAYCLLQDEKLIRHTFVYLSQSKVVEHQDQILYNDDLEQLIIKKIQAGSGAANKEIDIKSIVPVLDTIELIDSSESIYVLSDEGVPEDSVEKEIIDFNLKEEILSKTKPEYLAVYIKPVPEQNNNRWGTKARVILIINGFIYAEFLGRKCFDANTGLSLCDKWKIVKGLNDLPKDYAISVDFEEIKNVQEKLVSLTQK